MSSEKQKQAMLQEFINRKFSKKRRFNKRFLDKGFKDTSLNYYMLIKYLEPLSERDDVPLWEVDLKEVIKVYELENEKYYQSLLKMQQNDKYKEWFVDHLLNNYQYKIQD